ncbi:hypothetical protein AYI69_g1036 [Smittium culicis]|uniref:Uncharacterized protein n=1 Tax=Smittium culicis TaxID=133412 RepID=A0A1R1YRH4_9FUNG|nr:hypothetical protein AYI69_g1036 [Smittium culicis]
MTRINSFFFIINATAAALIRVNSTYVYEPLYKRGSNTFVSQKDIQAPTFGELNKRVACSLTLYDSNIISEIGWNERNLNFITASMLENKEILCSNCVVNENGELETISFPRFGKCI